MSYFGNRAPPPAPPPAPGQSYGQQNQQQQHQQQQHYQYSQQQGSYYQQQQYGQTANQGYANQGYASSPQYQQQQQQYQYSQGQYAQPQQQYAQQTTTPYYGQQAFSATGYGYQQQPAAGVASSYGTPAATTPPASSYASQYAAAPPPPAAAATAPAPPLAREPPVEAPKASPPPPAATKNGNGSSTNFQYSYAKPALQGNQASAAASNEPYGEVIPKKTSNESGLTHRSDAKRHFTDANKSPTNTTTYVAGASGGLSYGSAAPSAYSSGAMGFFQQTILEYQHNRMAVLFLLPPLLTLFSSMDSPYPIQTMIFLTLAMYGMDMANARDLLSVCLWVSAAILTLVTGWFVLLGTPDEDDGGLTTLSIILRTCGNCFLFLSLVSIRTVVLTIINFLRAQC